MIRIVLVAFTFGNVFSMLYSLGGWGLSILLMILCKKREWFSSVGISVIGGVGHNIGQLCVAALVVKQAGVFIYLPVLLNGSRSCDWPRRRDDCGTPFALYKKIIGKTKDIVLFYVFPQVIIEGTQS